MNTSIAIAKEFRENAIIALSVFVIFTSLGVIYGVNHLNKARTPERPMAIFAISSPAVAPSEALPVKAIATALSPEKALPEKAVIPLTAKLRHGEGIEHTLIRQLRAKHEGKSLKWAQSRAHQIALRAGFVSRTEEVRVKNGTRDIAYVLDEDGQQIISFLNGEEVARTSIATDSTHIQKVAPQSFEYVHHTPT